MREGELTYDLLFCPSAQLQDWVEMSADHFSSLTQQENQPTNQPTNPPRQVSAWVSELN